MKKIQKKDISEKAPAGSGVTASDFPDRPPIVVVLGHIDHGKTSLLDKIRQVDSASRETGGITQHIGAYQVSVGVKGRFLKAESEPAKDKPALGDRDSKTITFIDTPGHSAFSEMRSRGAKVADLAVLVVAADEGFKPQTKESLEHILAAKIPFLVAINKVDLPDVDVKKVSKQLVENGIRLEKEGGQIVAVEVSAKTGQGIKELLEMILLVAQMEEIKGDSESGLEAVIIESRLDRARGVLVTVLVRNGSLHLGQEITAEGISGKVKAMFDDRSQSVARAGPGQPVGVLGFKEVPPIGSLVKNASDYSVPAQDRQVNFKDRESLRAKVEDNGEEERKLKLVLKADTQGTLEAIVNSFPQGIDLVSFGVGDLKESDVLMADSVGAKLVGFRVKTSATVRKLAGVEGVKFEIFQTIYDLLEWVEEKVLKAMEPTIDEEILGQAEVIAEFDIKNQRVAGCRVTQGKISRRDKLHLKRNGEILADFRMKSMKKEKEKISVAGQGEEFGAIFSPSLDFMIGDVILSYRPKVEEK